MTKPNQSPLTHLYRFRTLQRLLGDKSKPEENHELEKQEIYFSPLADLNDPMEGFTDLVWKGDAVLWENLFRHYVICLERAIVLLGFFGEEAGHKINWRQIRIAEFDDPQRRSLQNEILNLFFSEETLHSCIGLLAKRDRPVRRNELSACLSSLHFFALSCICEVYAQHGVQVLTPDALATSKGRRKHLLSQVVQQIEVTKRVEDAHPNSERATDAIFASRRLIDAQMRLINQYNGIVDARLDNRNFVFMTFHEEYVREIERLVFPHWYTACLMDNCNDTAVWGHYSQGHTGVCLKFRVASEGNAPSLNLTMVNGVNGDGFTAHKVMHPLHKVEYTNDHIVVDFFNSIYLPIPTLRQYWYTGRRSSQSPSGIARLRSPEASSKAYWDAFYRLANSKLKAWEYEHEYRLILPGVGIDYSASADIRKATYDFSALEGIIFGMNTPNKDKLEIIRIIEAKCRSAGRSDFKFYQAYYLPEKGVIDALGMDLIKFRV